LLLGPIDPNEKANLFCRGEFLEPGDGAAGDDQRVAGGNWELVMNHGKEVVERQHTRGVEFAECGKSEFLGHVAI